MNKEQILEERQKLMERLQDEYQENLIPAMIGEKVNPEDKDEPVVLSILLDEMGSGSEEAYMDCCFMPIYSEDAKVQYFAAVITLADDLDRTYLPQLIESVSYVNAELPCGSFYVDRAHSFLVFRLAVPLPIALSGDALFEEIDIVSGNAVSIADMYYDLLLEVSRGESTIEDVIEFLGD